MGKVPFGNFHNIDLNLVAIALSYLCDHHWTNNINVVRFPHPVSSYLGKAISLVNAYNIRDSREVLVHIFIH